MTEQQLSALLLLRDVQGSTILFNLTEETAAAVKQQTETYFAKLSKAAATIDPRIRIPPILWRASDADADPYDAFRVAAHDRREWLTDTELSLRNAVFLTEVPRGWEGTLPPFPLHTEADFFDWLSGELPSVQRFQSEQSDPDNKHHDRQLKIAQQIFRNANSWLACHLNREIPTTPDDISECTRRLVNLLISFEQPKAAGCRDDSREANTKPVEHTMYTAIRAVVERAQAEFWGQIAACSDGPPPSRQEAQADGDTAVIIPPAPNGKPGRKPDPIKLQRAQKANALRAQSPPVGWKDIAAQINADSELKPREDEKLYDCNSIRSLHKHFFKENQALKR